MEIDEVIVGGCGNGYMANKTVVVGMKECDGILAMRVVESRTTGPMEAIINASILPDTIIRSDEFGSYRFFIMNASDTLPPATKPISTSASLARPPPYRGRLGAT